jgi:U4/U6 small nuclear ribonucleoprotein PRP4
MLEGHVGAITSTEFMPSGYEVATASADHSVRVHDIRKLKSSAATVPAHTNVVSRIRFHYQFKEPTTMEVDAVVTGI